jgi:uncharacterized protein DUF6600/FecR-like protein
MTRPLAAFAPLVLMLLATPVYAQEANAANADTTPAHIAFVEGDVVLERDGRPDDAPASMPLLAGDRVRTQAGRVEILFADGSALHADNHTVVDFQSDEVLRLLEGRIRLRIPGQTRDLNYRVDGPAAWVQIVEPGEFRFSVLRGERESQVELAVLRGAAELVNEDGRSLVRAGERAFARAGAQPSQPYVFNSAAWDDFDRWSEARRDQRLGVSAQYLPPDVRPYSATFDHYGSWRYEPVYGYVWYPRAVVGWRPYYHGRWVTLPSYGWTWIAHDPWGWPTHHYGRWGFSSGAWFWIPGSRWGAAWVSWAYAPNYVSWCPLGWNNRPVFSFVNINMFGGHRYEPWHAWTVVPRRHFGHGYVNVHAVPRIDPGVRRTFVVRDTAPEWRSRSRTTAPIRVAGTRPGTDYAVPRGTVGPAFSGADTRGAGAPDRRGFPAPAREARAPGVGRSADGTAPVTSAPQRAVPRDRSDRVSSPSADRNDSRINPGSRVAPQRSTPDVVRPREAPVTTVPPPEMRAVPRGSRDSAGRDPGQQPDWRRYDRAPDRRVEQPRSAPEYRSTPGGLPDRGYRAPEGDMSGDRYRAVPRQDAPRPSYEPPRESPRSSSPPPRQEAPRSSAPPPRQESQPSSAEPSRDAGASRSRGDRPSSGQATRRPGGR